MPLHLPGRGQHTITRVRTHEEAWTYPRSFCARDQWAGHDPIRDIRVSIGSLPGRKQRPPTLGVGGPAQNRCPAGAGAEVSAGAGANAGGGQAVAGATDGLADGGAAGGGRGGGGG
jgi:hypothetical protein